MQGRNSAADPRFTFHGSWERAERDTDGRGSFAAIDKSMSDRLLVQFSVVPPVEGSEGGAASGAARLPISGGSFANLSIRSSNIL